MTVPDSWKVYVLTKQNDNLREYLLKYWGYTKRMVAEVMETGQTPRRAEYLDDGTMVLGKKVTTTMEKKDNLRKYLYESWGYTEKMVDEIQETGVLDPALQPYNPPEDEPEDNAISPQHYQQGNIPVLDFITDQKFTYLEGNIVKYICRYKTKNGVEDLEKAEYYLKELKDTYCVDIKHKFAQQLDDLEEETLCG
tara:strand:- start:403 stop:987 length:585 start_codon:yes stop_codon:yes gene_type:complete